MYYISLDLEWNQAYAEQLQAVQKRLGARLRGEVIQIGAVKLDENMRICGSYSVIVRPKFFPRINRHVKKLTGITQDMLDRGVPLAQAAERFRRWCGEEFAFLTWGPDDIPMLEDNFRVHHLDTAWLHPVYDLQTIFNQQTDGSGKQRSLEFAMEHFKIEPTLPAHDALNDAYFTALVGMKLDMKKGVKEYKKTQGQFLEEGEIGNADIGETGFLEISDLLASPEAARPLCPLCGAPCEVLEKPLHSKGQRYTRLIRCETHKEMLMQLRLQRNFNETWRAKKTVAPADHEAVEAFHTKLKESERERKQRAHRRRHRNSKPQETAPGQTDAGQG